MNRDITLYGKRVTLELFKFECWCDVQRYKQWLIDPVVTRYMSSGLCRPTDDEIRDYANNGLLLAIHVVEWIGNIRLHQINQAQRVAELGIMIGEKREWGKGYATEACTLLLDYAFGRMNLNRVGIGVVSENEAGVALWKKLGFVEEGRLREAFWVDGRPCEVIRMGLLQREWYENRRSSSG
jgi:RimJ/RimL family protein N-acetyltransferase